MGNLPERFERFLKEYPAVAQSYEAMGNAVHTSGPLDEKSRVLIKLSLSIGAGMEGAVHSHVRKALDKGLSKDEIRHAAILAIPTIGLPASMAALSWIDDILDKN